VLRSEPLLDYCHQPGWFLGVSSDIVVPHFKDRLRADVPVGAFTTSVHIPGAQLDWTASPRIELGYRFGEGLGQFVVSYRSLESEGNGLIQGFDLDGSTGFVRSRLNVNVLDVDFVSHEYALGPCWGARWKVGTRLASVYFDSLALGPFTEQRTSNDFRGIGPHFGLDVRRTLTSCGLDWFGRLETAALFGDIEQHFEQAMETDETLQGGAIKVRHTQTVPVVAFQTGLSWVPPGRPHLRLEAGYEYEMWWDLGRVKTSRAELTDQGVFLRAEIGF
jgi:hypothetical protein